MKRRKNSVIDFLIFRITESFEEFFSDCLLAEILSQFSPPSALGTFLADTALYSPVLLRMQMLIFLLRNQLLIQLHTFIYLMPPLSNHKIPSSETGHKILSARIRTAINSVKEVNHQIKVHLMDLCGQAIASGISEPEVFWLVNSFVRFVI